MPGLGILGTGALPLLALQLCGSPDRCLLQLAWAVARCVLSLGC